MLQRVNKKQAEQLKELGYADSSWSYYTVNSEKMQHCTVDDGYPMEYSNLDEEDVGETFLAPETALAIKWIRDKFTVHISVDSIGSLWFFSVFKITRGVGTKQIFESDESEMEFEEAESKALSYVLNLLIQTNATFEN